MEYVDKLLQKTDFLKQLKKLEQLEQNREFCRHGLNHLLDTARIAWIRYLELLGGLDKESEAEQCQDKEMIYLAALLHDLGRIKEYEEGISHHVAGTAIAEDFLGKISYPKEKSKLIVSAIHGHPGTDTQVSANTGENGTEGTDLQEKLSELLRYADKKSRNCFYCEVQEACKWQQERRNQTITV